MPIVSVFFGIVIRHGDELSENWELARAGKEIRRIAPLA